MTSLLALVMIGHSGAVTFSGPAMTVPQLLSRLTLVIGKALTASSDMDNEVLFVQVKAMDSARLMNLIAELSWGKWESTAKGSRLVRDKARLRRGEAEEAEETGRRIQARIPASLGQLGPWDASQAARRRTDLQEILNPPKDWGNPAWEAARRERYFAEPAQRALARLLLDAPASRLGEVAPWSEGHFGSEPNLVQKDLGLRAPAILKTYDSEEGAFEAASVLSPPDSAWDDWATPTPTPTVGPFHAVVNLHRDEPDIYKATAGFFDETGKLNTSGSFKLELNSYPLPPELRAPALLRSHWKVSKDALASVKGVPAEHQCDPLVGIGEGLSKVATTLSDSIVACIPDDTLPLCDYMLLRNGEPTPAQFLEAIRPEMRFSVADGLIVGQPVFGGTSRSSRINRMALKELIALALRKHYLDFDDLGPYFRTQEFGSGLEECQVDSVLKGSDPWREPFLPICRETRLAIRFWTQLDARNQQAMSTADGIPLNQLGEGARQTLATLVFGGASSFGEKLGRQGGFCDATIGLPDGLPDKMVCSAQVEFKPQVFLVRHGVIAGYSACSDLGTDVAIRNLIEERGGKLRGLTEDLEALFLPDTEQCVTLNFRVPNRPTISIQISEHIPDLTANPGDEASLPEAQRRAIQAGMEAWDQARKAAESKTKGTNAPNRP